MCRLKQTGSFLFLIALILANVWTILPSTGSSPTTHEQEAANPNDTIAESALSPSSASDPTVIGVIISFTRPVDANDMAVFEDLGGEITHGPWSYAVAGFAGTILDSQISALKAALPDATVERDQPVASSLNYVSRLARARNYTWDTLGLNGTSNGTIAILDTGITTSSYDAFDWDNTVISWNDTVNDLTTPYDDNGHGSFVASAIASRGITTESERGAMVANFTANLAHQDLFGASGIMQGSYEHKLLSLNVTEIDTNITVLSKYLELSSGEVTQFQFELRNSSQTTVTSVIASTNVPCTVEYNITSRVGVYDFYIHYDVPMESTFAFTVESAVSWHCALQTDTYLNSTGVAPGSKLSVVKVLDETGQGTFADVIEGLNWVIANRSFSHIVAACLSVESTDLTTPESLEALNDTLDIVIEAGILVVVAAGNKGVIPNALNRIALNPKVLVVGATNEDDQITSYSSQGETVGGIIKPDVVAPGGSMLPAHVPVYGASNYSNQLVPMEGTSISAAVVAGAVNILLQAMGSYPDGWNYTNGKSALEVKARLLMTATETNLEREDDPVTLGDESLSSPTLSRGTKDIHEGYGRINIDAAAESYLLTMTPAIEERDNLTSSITSPQGKHAWARRVNLTQNQPYLLILTVPLTGDFDLYLYRNYSDELGEPVLISKSVSGISGTSEQIYFTPSNESREYIIVIKAVSGYGEFALNSSLLQNYAHPVIQAIWMASDDPGTNNTWSTYTVYVNYTDADNNPPVSVTLSITNATMSFFFAENYTMIPQNPANQNFTINSTYYRSYGVELPGDYRVYVRVFDGIYFNESEILVQSVNGINAASFPYINDFYYNYPGKGSQWLASDAIANWSFTSAIADRWYFHYYPYWPFEFDPGYLEYKPFWHFSMPYYGGTWSTWNYAENLDASLSTPYVFLTNADNPIVRVGIRVSLALGDFFFIDLQENNSAWTTLQLYTATEIDWTELEFNLTEYEDSYVRLRFRCTTDGVEDSLQNKGVIVDSVSFVNYTNTNLPELTDSFDSPWLHHSVEPQAGSRFQKYRFNVIYRDDNMPTFVYLEMSGINHTMYNSQADVWRTMNRWDPNIGILYSANITVTDFSLRQYRFHASDGVTTVTTEWFTDGPTVQENPNAIAFPFQETFAGSGYESWYVAGTPDKLESHEWLKTNTSWDIVNNPLANPGTPSHFWYCGVQTVILAQRYYGPDWDAWLVSKPIEVNSPQDVHLYFSHMLNFEFTYGDDQAFVDISTDYGRTFTTLVTFGGLNNTGLDWEHFDIDISKYNHKNITLRFRFVSDDVENPVPAINRGWRLSHIEVNASVEIIAPSVVIQFPDLNYELAGTVQLNFTITDNTGVDIDRVEFYINNELVTPTIWVAPDQVVHLSYIWETTETPNGLIRIRIVAFDTYGNSQTFSYNAYVNNPFDWFALLIWVITIAAIVAFAAVGYKTRFFTTIYDRTQAAKRLQIKSSATKGAQALGLPIITDDLVNETIEAQEGFTLHCKECKKEFHSQKFEWMCPACDKDSLFIKTYCIYCGTPALLEDPRKSYCKKCGSRLLRQPNKSLSQLRAAIGTGPEGAKTSPARKRAYPVITDNIINEEEEAKEVFTLKCKKCGTMYQSDRFLWTCAKCQGDTLYMRTKCLHCDRELLLDSPRKNHCEKCKSRLLRQPERWAAKNIDLDFTKEEDKA